MYTNIQKTLKFTNPSPNVKHYIMALNAYLSKVISKLKFSRNFMRTSYIDDRLKNRRAKDDLIKDEDMY